MADGDSPFIIEGESPLFLCFQRFVLFLLFVHFCLFYCIDHRFSDDLQNGKNFQQNINKENITI